MDYPEPIPPYKMCALQKNTSSHEELVERLKASPFYQICQNAFRDATNLPLIIISSDNPQFNPCRASPNQNPFCRHITASREACQDCIKEQDLLLSNSREKAYTHTCFAGLEETSVPLRLGKKTIGFLRTGQIFIQKPSAEKIKALHDTLAADKQLQTKEAQILKEYEKTPVFEEKAYSSMVTLLSIISLQLTDLLNRLLLESQSEEPKAIQKAKAYIADHIDERIALEQIASEVNVSVFYFCKLFKQTTGMTFTEYVNRQRIELAKGVLKDTSKSITEIAYAVGYQSLSQFNRSFLKFTGESPRQYRQHIRTVPESL
mgnify:CR=1 FL=1